MAKINNNVDLVKDLMNHSKFDALGQIFIVEAIRAYVDFQIKNKENTLEEYDNKVNNMPEGQIYAGVDMHSWVAVAEDVKERMDDFYINRRK